MSIQHSPIIVFASCMSGEFSSRLSFSSYLQPVLHSAPGLQSVLKEKEIMKIHSFALEVLNVMLHDLVKTNTHLFHTLYYFSGSTS